MKNVRKVSVLLVLALALSLGLVASVWAQPMGKGWARVLDRRRSQRQRLLPSKAV